MPFGCTRPARFMVIPAALAASALLSACDTLDQWEAEEYRHKCESLGIAPGSPSFDNCILQQQKLEEEGIQHSMDRDAQKHHK